MKKENILVVALIAIAVAGVILYNDMGRNNESPDSGPAIAAAPLDGTGESSSNELTGTPQAASTTAINWQNFAPGMAMAGKQGKNIFLYFGADWCTYCRKLKQTTFKDKAVLAYLAENFISIEVDTDKDPDIATRWQVKGLPTLWFLEPDGSRIDRIPGYLDADQMLKVMEFIHSKSYTQMDFNEFMKRG